jgi:hypothetical protein
LALLQVALAQSAPPTHAFLLPHTQPLPAAEQSVAHPSEWPHPSPMVPQYWPPEVGLQVSGVQPAVGPALHKPSWQIQPAFKQVVPQSRELPQPSPTIPQYWSPLAVVQVSGAQPALGPALHRLSWQVHPAFGHVVPQWRVNPHPLPISPQYWSPVAVVQASGTQPAVGPALHRPSWQVHPAFVHAVPQSSVNPHPSPMAPQYWSPLAVVQASGRQPAIGPALHRLSWQVHPVFVHVVPHASVDPHPSPMSPQYWSPDAVVQVLGTQWASSPALHRPLSHTQPALGQVTLHSSVPPQPSPIAPQ